VVEAGVSDPEERARLLALGTEMLSKKKRDEILDNSFNRYAFNDDNLPAWFADDVRKHSLVQLPVTKDKVDMYRERFQAIDARPIKKVLEAKARKRRKEMRMQERINAQAGKIAEDTEMTEGAKSRAIEKLFSKSAAVKAKKRPKPRIVVANKGGQTNEVTHRGKSSGGRVKMVDRRMKSTCFSS